MELPRLRLSAQREIGPGAPTFVVAEIGQNHNGQLAAALRLVDAAAWAGADAVKFVKRDLDCDLSRALWNRPYDSPHAYGATYGEHRRALELSATEHAQLAEHARRHGLIYFATACDVPSAELLDQLDVPLFKVASRDLTNLPLIESLSTRRRPLLLSTGMSGWDDIDRAVGVVRRARCRFAVLQCTSLYPAPMEEAHLHSLSSLAERYRAVVGFSDHTPGGLLSPVAVALGARIIEKHLTLDRHARGRDHACSLEAEEFARLVRDVRSVEMALGSPHKPVAPGIEPVRQRLGRSVVARVPLAQGAVLEAHMLALKCPGDGLSWRAVQQLLGCRLKHDIPADVQLSWDDFDEAPEAPIEVAA